MQALFISDLHLSADRPEANERFFGFIEGKARSAEALYVLGDLFESWIGDDDIVERFNAVIAGFFAALAASGAPLYLMHGNRDFLDRRALLPRRPAASCLPTRPWSTSTARRRC